MIKEWMFEILVVLLAVGLLVAEMATA